MWIKRSLKFGDDLELASNLKIGGDLNRISTIQLTNELEKLLQKVDDSVAGAIRALFKAQDAAHAAQIEAQTAQIEALSARVKQLENTPKKNSGNSSLPPSMDIGKKKRTKSLRKKGKKKQGGQPGHKATNPEMSANPDEVVKLPVNRCSECGENLETVKACGQDVRQLVDLPPSSFVTTEYQAEQKVCPGCQAVNKAVFPAGVDQKTQYGPRITALIVYLHSLQFIPFKRSAQLCEDIFGRRINESTQVSMVRRTADHLTGFIGELTEIMLSQEVLHGDESGIRVEGKSNWLHVLATETHTMYKAHMKRGAEGIEAMGVIQNYKGTLIHDFWASYTEYQCDHGLCNQHHLRDLEYCREAEESETAVKLSEYLLDLYKTVNKAKEEGRKSLTQQQLGYWNRKFDRIIAAGWEEHPLGPSSGKRGRTKKSKIQNLLERFTNYPEWVLAFAYNFSVPFTNNIAEQAIRMCKVKTKISGSFRSIEGAQNFATIRSYISTMQKQGKSVFEALLNAVNGRPYTSGG